MKGKIAQFRWAASTGVRMSVGVGATRLMVSRVVFFNSLAPHSRPAEKIRDLRDVHFTPESGHRLNALECPLCAKSRHCYGLSLRVFIHFEQAILACLQRGQDLLPRSPLIVAGLLDARGFR
jgi:hypothetical protein